LGASGTIVAGIVGDNESLLQGRFPGQLGGVAGSEFCTADKPHDPPEQLADPRLPAAETSVQAKAEIIKTHQKIFHMLCLQNEDG
jgi:hypothetical protein